MADPIFRLEGVIKTKDEMGDFEGPLTLILQLLSKNRIEIKDISVSLILDQYLEYLDEMSEMDMEIASEFIEMAARLLYIKTKVLLSGDREVDELAELISSLERIQRRDIYTQIKTVTDEWRQLYCSGSGYIEKPPEYFPVDNEYKFSHSREELRSALLAMFDRESGRHGAINIQNLVYPKKDEYPISKKAVEILEQLKERGVLRMVQIFNESESRSELVASFIAILELCKAGNVLLAGDGDGLTISYTGAGAEDTNFMDEAARDGNS